jgi:hypothetical protein
MSDIGPVRREGPGRPAAVSLVLDAGVQPAVRQELGGVPCFGQRGRAGILDVREVGEEFAGQLRGLALGVAGRCRERQPAQQRPQLLPVAGAVGHRRLQRRPGLLHQREQPLGRIQPLRHRVEPLVELVAYDLAGLRLHLDEAGRPGEGAGGIENLLVGFAPPRTGLRPAGQGIGHIKQRVRFLRAEAQRQRREILLAGDGWQPLSQLLGTPLRVAADALAGGFAFPGTLLLRCHAVRVTIRDRA